jgi:hypothetical protein
MTKEYCDECNKEIDVDYDESEMCSDCGQVHFCTSCSESLKKDKPYILMCQVCEIDYDDAMSEHDNLDGGW